MPRIRRSSDGPEEILNGLPGTEREAAAVASLLKTRALIGDKATKANVLPRMAAAGLVHLATHGLLDEDGRNFNALALAPDEHDSGLLTAREVRALRLNADLVVLSACDTARGEITGDGVHGLTRSFFAAGARSLVVSLWQVADEATVVLMTSFYEGLQKGQDKAQALRQAMLATRSQYPDPRRWSALTLVGNADVSRALAALLKGDRLARRIEIDSQGSAAQTPYRYFVFPIPDRARLRSEDVSPDGTGVDISLDSDLGARELMAFYRSELARRGLREDLSLTRYDGRNFQLVFNGLTSGKIVIQGTGSGQGEEGFTVSLRVEPMRP